MIVGYIFLFGNICGPDSGGMSRKTGRRTGREMADLIGAASLGAAGSFLSLVGGGCVA